MPNKKSLCIVFDLDDTLYQERDYQLSGFRAVAEYCQFIYGKNIKKEIFQWDCAGESDVFGRICYELGLPANSKESFLWVYRNHFPQISLSDNVSEVIHRVQDLVECVAILTDGRSTTQRMKLKALGLNGLPAFISEEWSDSKPGKVRFEAIQEKFQAKSYWYVGDNPMKDFLAPNELGWLTIGLIGNQQNTHSQETQALSEVYVPKIWIADLDELVSMI